MSKRHISVASALALLISLVGCEKPAPPHPEGKAFLDRYQALENACDPAIIDMFAWDCEMMIVFNFEGRAGGKTQTVPVKGEQLREVLREGLKICEEKGLNATYSKVKYKPYEREGKQRIAIMALASRTGGFDERFDVAIEKRGKKWQIIGGQISINAKKLPRQ